MHNYNRSSNVDAKTSVHTVSADILIKEPIDQTSVRVMHS